jgi:hypothetical protein
MQTEDSKVNTKLHLGMKTCSITIKDANTVNSVLHILNFRSKISFFISVVSKFRITTKVNNIYTINSVEEHVRFKFVKQEI